MCALVTAGCGDNAPSHGPDAAGTEDTLFACEALEVAGTTSLAHVSSTLVGAVKLEMERVEAALSANPSTEEGEAEYTALGFDRYTLGEGIPHVQRTDLGGTTDFATRKSLAYFVHLSDPQLADDESPIRLGNLDNPIFGGGLRPQEAYVGQMLSAFNRTLTRIEGLGREFDFGVITGDCIDSAQYNELRWFIDIMDGASGVETDSGEDNDPVAGVDDPKDPFDAVAFPAPWYFVFGNHDLQVVGTSVTADSAGVELGAVGVLGTRDYREWGAPVSNEPIPPDADRRFVDRDQIISELQNTPSLPGPVGHGFADGASTEFGANYAVDVVPGLLRLISIDTNDDTGGGQFGMFTQSRLDGFLIPALEQAQSDGVLVMLALHHPSGGIDRREAENGDVIEEALEPEQLRAAIAAYPNVILALVGHSHDNRVKHIAGADAEHPGYWEMTTSAIADWPTQVRVLEIVDNGNDTLSIFATLVDHDEDTCLERRFRRLSAIDYVSGWSGRVSADPLDLNVELIVPIPSSVQAAVASAAASAATRIESQTTLALP
tara:strand:+ start:21622 stop:23265 length:1644 start_codon:yes stop_codon:yes gene_type:complete